MKPKERQKEIINILHAMQKEIRVEELSKILSTSPLTIRRDLQELAAKKMIIRTHGGCIIAGRAALETEYHKKVAQNYHLKQAIGKQALKYVNPGDVLLINDGSTTYHLAKNLNEKAPLTVYTNSLAMISEIGTNKDIMLYIIGGLYIPELYSLRGSLTEKILESITIDVTFIGTDAINEEGRLLTRTPEEASLSRAMLKSGRKNILLADHTKLTSKGYVVFGSLQEIDLWITTEGIEQSKLDEFRKMTDILIAKV